MAKKVLVVDDEKLIVKGIRFSLEQDGMDVVVNYRQLPGMVVEQPTRRLAGQHKVFVDECAHYSIFTRFLTDILRTDNGGSV